MERWRMGSKRAPQLDMEPTSFFKIQSEQSIGLLFCDVYSVEKFVYATTNVTIQQHEFTECFWREKLVMITE